MKSYNHTDILGRIIQKNNVVAAPFGKCHLEICKVIKVNQRMITVSTIKNNHKSLKYPEHLLVLKDTNATLGILHSI